MHGALRGLLACRALKGVLVIVDFGELEKLHGKVTMVDGGFDPLHAGHVAYFNEARKLGLPVLCNISADAYVSTKHPVVVPQDSRAQVIDAIESIDYVHVSSHSTAEVLAQARPKFYAKGKDWEGRLPDRETAICKQYGIDVVYLDTVIDSSTALLRKLLDVGTLSERVSQYEEFVLNQTNKGADNYDVDYYHADWRDQANDYRLETRRRIEARNPELIREVFQPRKILDMGCGPGALMTLLHELGLDVSGVDFAEASKQLADPAVRDRISVGSVIDVALPDNAFDLVICREVFEHMTVLQCQKSVQNICRITSKYVYLTTRFHGAPRDLFDVTTEFEVDPTHITLMNMDMLRLMYVLQGMRRRRDLETKMDWLNKGRVLVYEKVSAQ